MSDRVTRRILTSVLLGTIAISSSLDAQSLPVPPVDNASPQDQFPSLAEKSSFAPSLDKEDLFPHGFAGRLLKDEKTLWTSPLRMKWSAAKWLVPLGGATAFLISKDSQISHHFDDKTSLQNQSLKVSKLGPYAAWSVPGAFLAVGAATHNARLMDTGERTLQATLHTEIVAHGIKALTDRTRPYQGGDGHFWNGGNSFPSGHSMTAWALAEVIAEEYPHNPLVKIGAYSFASAVSLSRLTSERHYASDVLIGSATGYLIGRFVMRHHRYDDSFE